VGHGGIEDSGLSIEGKIGDPRSSIHCSTTSVGQVVQRLLEAVGVRALGLRERLKPFRYIGEAFLARGLGHARVHVGVLLARDRRLEIYARLPDR